MHLLKKLYLMTEL